MTLYHTTPKKSEATCKDCIHHDVCYHIEHYGRELETKEPCKQFKSADVVEVVRCRDCKHFTEGMAIGIMCKRVEDKPIFPMPYNNYCGFGERREVLVKRR